MKRITVKTGRFNISEVAIKRPVTTIMMMLMLVIIGFISYGRLSIELFPNVSIPVVTISTTYFGASASEIETLVTKPIEDVVSGINGVEHIRSVSSNNLSSVIIEFKLEKDIKDATNEVREKVALIRNTLPAEVEEPKIARVDFESAPIINYSISGKYPIPKLTDLIKDKIKPRLEQVEGVAAINILGGQEREIQVTLDPSLLQKYGLTLSQISTRLKSENLNFPSGNIKTPIYEITLRTTNAFSNAEQIANLPIQISGGKIIFLKDLGTVKDEYKEMRNKTWFNGVQCVVISVQKQSGTNTVQIVKDLNKKIEELKRTIPSGVNIDTLLPEGVDINVGFDTSKFITQSKDASTDELIVGAFLAVIIIFLFLRIIRVTIIAAIAIPTSIISTYTMIYIMGFSLNMMTLLALSITVGILVDDAVVDLENIFRHMEMGKTPYQAAIDATNEIWLAVMATTFTIVVVFMPLAFMSGIIGQFFKQFGLTVVFAVLMSLLVARTLTPALAAYLLKPIEKKQKPFILAEPYKQILEWSLNHRLIIVIVATITFIVSLPLSSLLPRVFQPQSDRDEFSMSVQMPSGSTLDQTIKILNKIAFFVRQEKLVKNILITAGNSRGNTDVGSLGVTLYSKNEGRKEKVFDIQKRLQRITANIPGCLITYKETRVVEDATSNYAMNLSLRGDDLNELQKLADKIIKKLHTIPIVTDTNTSSGTPQPEIHIVIDKDRAASLGISVSTIATTLRVASYGDVPSTMHLLNTNVDIRVRLTDTTRYDLTKLGDIGIPTIQGTQVPLRTIATLSYANGPTNINRYDRQRQIMVYANTIPGTPLGNLIQIMEKEMKNMNIPPGITYDFQGEAQRMKDAFSEMTKALFLGIIFIYLVLASQFEHFIHPFTIMMALPLSFIGVFLALFITNKELGLMSLIGIVMLMGLVCKNSILVIDYTIKLRKAGMERNEALLTAGPIRLRPILMTTMGMICGMFPIALGLTPGSEGRAPMAIGVIGGLITSTMLTLVVVPVVYTIIDDIMSWLGRITKIKIYVPSSEEIISED